MAKSLLIAFLIAIMVGGLALAGTVRFGMAQNSTNVIGIISSDTTWTKANSPYTLTGPVLVSEGVTLTIEAGATVNLNDYYIRVNGTLVARGSSADPIHFNGGSNVSPNYAITFTQSSTSWNEQTGSGSIIENANLDSTTLITIRSVSPKISGNSGGRIYVCGGSPIITRNNIMGIAIAFGSPTITYNNIYNGIVGSSIYNPQQTLSDMPIISNNNISGLPGGIDLNGCSPIITNNTIVGVLIETRGTFGYSYDIYTTKYGIRFDRDENHAGWPEKKNHTAIISGNTILNCTTAGINVVTGSAVIEGNLIYNNTDGIDVGPGTLDGYNTDSKVMIQNNTITNNPTAIKLNNAPPTMINYNNIQNYSQSIYLQDTPNNIDATNNWWGTTNTQLINQTIHDFKNDFNLGTVNFIPFLTAPNPAAPTVPATTSPDQSSTQGTPQAGLYGIIAVLGVIIVALLIVIVALVLRKRR